MSYNPSCYSNSNYPLMMNSEWNAAPWNEDDSYIDEEESPPQSPEGDELEEEDT